MGCSVCRRRHRLRRGGFLIEFALKEGWTVELRFFVFIASPSPIGSIRTLGPASTDCGSEAMLEQVAGIVVLPALV